jgi:hypothetical protein
MLPGGPRVGGTETHSERRRLLVFVRLLGRYLNSATEVERITRLCKRASSQYVRRSAPTSGREPARLTPGQNEKIAALEAAGWWPAGME